MADLPFPWSIYAEHQATAARCDRVNDRFWGIENGLTNLIRAVESDGVPSNQEEFRQSIDRAIATASWVERNHAGLRRKYIREEEPRAESGMLARIALEEIRGSVSAEEWSLLVAVAAGIAYHGMTRMTAGAARTRIARLRARLRAFAQTNTAQKGGFNV